MRTVRLLNPLAQVKGGIQQPAVVTVAVRVGEVIGGRQQPRQKVKGTCKDQHFVGHQISPQSYFSCSRFSP